MAENNERLLLLFSDPVDAFFRLFSAVCLLVIKSVAGVLGFEPRYAGIKTLCLTAWRHPNNLRIWAVF